jgi:adenosylmethionine-8-amino-7-oxononanoate aminotransferase
LAALIVEPLVQGAAGILVHPPGYLAGLRELTRKYGVLLIADEVAVGFGRTGTMFACEQEEVAPDFLCLGKGLTGGYLPMSAMLTTSAVFEAFLGPYDAMKTFFHGHTYGGNPLAAAAALATLELFKTEKTLENMGAKIARLAAHLARLAGHPHVGHVRQKGLMAGIELVADKRSKAPFGWQERRGAIACRHALDHGVWLRPLGDVVVIMPPLSVALEELDKILLAAERGIEAATRQSCGKSP